MTEARDYRDTVFLPKTDFPMKAGLPQKEPGILERWQAIDVYAELRKRRADRPQFILHDGPPYANGDMHIGHALNHILKDMVCRTQSLLGKDAPYVPGWDCHGLPIEWRVEEEYRKKKRNKDEVPVKEFRAECRAYAQKWVDVQRDQVKRLGILGNWDKPYLTMDFDSEATIVSELLKFAASGQLYRGAKPVMWSPVEKTALAEAEVEYEDITSTQIDVAFEIVSSPIPELVGAHAVIWTTTPWTIPVNQAIAYGPDVEYDLVNLNFGMLDQDGNSLSVNRDVEDEIWLRLSQIGLPKDREFLIADDLADQFMKRVEAQIVKLDFTDLGVVKLDLGWGSGCLLPKGATSAVSVKGSDLAGTIARHPMAKLLSGEGRSPEGQGAADDGLDPGLRRGTIDADSPLAEFYLRPRPFLPGDFVTTDSGTGLVHMAPDHGEDDFDLCKVHGIEPVFAVQGDGKYRDDWTWLGGQGSVINPKFNAPDGPICSDLREAGGLLAASADYKHSYPHSWRSKAKVIYRCTPQWFVAMDEALKPSPLQGRGLGEGTVSPTQSRPESGGAAPSPSLSPEGERDTLRTRALTAIQNTRWVPEKGENRIRSMVEGRPDWVLSRQRAWGVPITLFVDRKTGQYLNDPAVNARIVAAVKAQGVDGWSDEAAPALLGPEYNAADYERVTDILDVWFDSGCTHAFVLESGKWPELLRRDGSTHPADLYLEGSDQHRGWFQSSLLESCGTRGQAPYKAVLTHGFTMDQKGMKMSKSIGNTVDPLKVMQTNGADIIRLWALSVDFTEDHRIGDEILKGVADQYRKLRNTFRYLLGALDGYSEAERVPVDEMPELERYVLHLLAEMDAKLRQAVDDFDYNSYVRLLSDFANNDLSAFFFDIRKDSLYCDAATSPKRMAYRTVLDILFHALVRYAAPVLVFTAEEVWQTRFPDEAESVHFLEWPEVPFAARSPAKAGVQPLQDATVDAQLDPGLRRGTGLMEKWALIRNLRALATEQIEPLRREKVLGSSLEAEVTVPSDAGDVDLSEIFISATVHKGEWGVTKTTHHKCGRCWRHLPEVTEDGTLCGRCEEVVNG